MLAHDPYCQIHLAANPGLSFEALVQSADIGHSSTFEAVPPSCGNTVRCWTALFLSASQINHDALYQISIGGLWHQLWNNPNCLLLWTMHHTARALQALHDATTGSRARLRAVPCASKDSAEGDSPQCVPCALCPFPSVLCVCSGRLS